MGILDSRPRPAPGCQYSGRCARPQSLLLQLSADLAAGVLGGVDVDVVQAGREVAVLRLRQLAFAFGGRRVRNRRERYDDTRVLARLGGPVNVAGGRGAGEPAV